MAEKKEAKDYREYVSGLVAKARKAQAAYAGFTQEQLDKAARAAAKSVYDNAELLAVEAVEETGMGTVEGKIKKMRGAMTNQWAYSKGRVSKGIVGWEKGKLDVDCILKIAKPAGVIAGVMPVTNPTTTMGANAMQALKAGNAIIVCPHPRAKNVSLHCADIIRKAIAATGAPEDLVQCVDEPAIALTGEVMAQCDLVVATGGPNIVKAANSSGNPSLGVGQGNCQVIIDKGMTGRFDEIAADIMVNRAYDSGIPCTGEQTIIVPECDKQAMYDAVNRNKGMVVTDPTAIEKLRQMLFKKNEATGEMTANPTYVGMDIKKLGAEMGVEVPDGVLSIVVEISKYGDDDPLCNQQMCPTAAMITYSGDWEEAVHIAKTNLLMEGAGHSTDIYTEDKDHQIYAGLEIPVCRMPVNVGQGAVGGRPYYTGGMPSTSGIGCGYWQKNMLGENLTFEHLLNYTRMLYKVDADPVELTDEEVWAENE